MAGYINVLPHMGHGHGGCCGREPSWRSCSRKDFLESLFLKNLKTHNNLKRTCIISPPLAEWKKGGEGR